MQRAPAAADTAAGGAAEAFSDASVYAAASSAADSYSKLSSKSSSRRTQVPAASASIGEEEPARTDATGAQRGLSPDGEAERT